jgi:hypothetical protein
MEKEKTIERIEARQHHTIQARRSQEGRGTRLRARQEGIFYATEQGIADLGGDIPTMPPPGPQLVDFWARKIKAASKLLRYLADQYPNFITREELGSALSLSTAGGTFGTYLSRLRTPGLIEEQGDQLRAAPQLMEAA